MNFQHHYAPGTDAAAPPLILLHGTGGDERDLLPLAEAISPGSTVLSPLGKVREGGMPRFFRRFAEGVFDIEDLKFRTGELADFLTEAATRYGFPLERAIALGFSNGANIAASLLLLRPAVLGGAILLRATMPFTPDETPNLSGRRVLLSTGDLDQMTPLNGALQLARTLREGGAEVTHIRQAGAGHGLTQRDIQEAESWLSARTVG